MLFIFLGGKKYKIRPPAEKATRIIIGKIYFTNSSILA
jgi:hypothetical protein